MIVKYTIQAIRDADKYNKDMKKALNYARENGIIISYKRN
jgi:RNA-splicing ligase RtcB